MATKILTKKFLYSIFAMEILIGGLALVFIALALWNKPLGPSLEIVSPVNAQESNPLSDSGLDSPGSEPLPEVQPTPSSLVGQIASLIKPPKTVVKTVCGGPPVMTLEVIGSDQRGTGYNAGLSDSIRIVRIDFVNPGVMVLDMPRDLWVEIPGIADHGVTHGKLNQPYLFGNPGLGFYDGPGEGPGLLARTLDLNYGMKVDHYLAMDMHTFRNMIDSIGGVDIYLDYRIDFNEGQDGANPNIVFEPGYYHLDGEQALMFSRSRIPTIFQRARFQNIILSALQDKLLSPAMIPELPGLITQFTGSVQTDLSPNEINQLICIGPKLTEENIRIVAFPDDMFSSDSTYDPYRQVYTYTLAVDAALLRTYIAAFMNGTWPEN